MKKLILMGVLSISCIANGETMLKNSSTQDMYVEVDSKVVSGLKHNQVWKGNIENKKVGIYYINTGNTKKYGYTGNTLKNNAGYIIDSNGNIAPSQICQSGYSFNQDCWNCVPSSCPSNQFFDPHACSCVNKPSGS